MLNSPILYSLYLLSWKAACPKRLQQSMQLLINFEDGFDEKKVLEEEGEMYCY